jgi:hypothetical protein
VTPRVPTQGDLDRDADRLEWCRDTLIQLVGADGKSGVLAAALVAIQVEHTRSATSQGTRIGDLETDVKALKTSVADLKGFRRTLLALGALGMLVLGAVVNKIFELF